MVDPEGGISPSKSKGSHFEIVSGFQDLKSGEVTTAPLLHHRGLKITIVCPCANDLSKSLCFLNL
jgi:hypothetical protein